MSFQAQVKNYALNKSQNRVTQVFLLFTSEFLYYTYTSKLLGTDLRLYFPVIVIVIVCIILH